MAAPRLLRHPVVPFAGGGIAVALVVGLAIAAPGYDSREVPHLDTSVWVTRAAGQYARLNTDLAQLDTIRSVADPSALVQSGSAGAVFGQGNRQFWPIDPAVPADLVVDDASGGSGSRHAVLRAQAAPDGTRSIQSSGSWMLALTDTGAAYLASVDPDSNETQGFALLDPFAAVEVADGEERPVFAAVAGAVGLDGDVVLYSAVDHAVRRWDGARGAFSGEKTAVPEAPESGDPLAMALVGDRWVMISPSDGRIWVEGLGAPVSADFDADARLQASSAGGDRAYLATPDGLLGIQLGSGAVSTVAEASGTPAAPTELDGVMYAAWLSTDSGQLWSSDAAEPIPLDTDADTLDAVQSLQPVLRTNGDRMVLNETASGLLWLVPSGTLIPVSQWSDDEVSEVTEGEITVDDASEQLPPTAEPDAFGVRSGALVALPVLLNDHDPNRSDVLSVVPSSLQGGLADSAFGDLVLTSGGQALAVRVRAASGSTSFSYSVTDGFAVSAPVTVTLSVVAEGQNAAPVWCGVADCKEVWPTPQIAAGGTIEVPVLTGWVDPDGDPFVLSEVRPADPSAPIAVVPTSDGQLAIRHLDPNAGAQLIVVTVSVMDARGAVATRDLEVSVSSAPTLTIRPGAYLARVGASTVVDVTGLVSGGSGAYRLLDAVDSSARAGALTLASNTADGTVTVSASAAGEYAVSVTVQDIRTLAERSAVVRFTVLSDPLPLSTPPLTAFVRAGEDSTIGVLDAVQNTTGRVLIVASATSDTPLLTAGVVAQTHVRVRGSTADGLPGPIGTVRYLVTDGAGMFAEGTIAVFLVAPSRDAPPIAVNDAVTVRAGALVDIPVLANDVGPRGERLAVHPDLVGSGTAGELAFVSGTSVRYLAPKTAGVYTLSYSAYLEASPDRLATAQIEVTVLADGQNRPPEPRGLVARVLAGGSVEIPVDRFGIDPDGDVVTLTDVGQPQAGQGVATISATGESIVYRAPESGVRDGQVSFDYTVRDAEGQSATGSVQVGVLGGDVADVTPVTFSEHVRVRVNSTAPLTVQPLLNDRDPAQGTLAVTDLVPNAPAGSPEYTRLEGLIGSDTSLDDGVVSLLAGDIVGTQSYIYTVQSSATSSTAQGLIVVTVAEGATPDRPLVQDTVIDLTTRHQLSDGVDVVSNKVTWITGDPATLTLSLWDTSSTRYQVSGWAISGEAPLDGDLVPFRLDGTDAEGAPVVAYGFLRIPAFDDMRLQLAPNFAPVPVDEEQHVDFRVADALRVDSSDAVELRDGSPFSVQRPNSSCVRLDAARVEYTAGRDAPWSDSCAVFVRVQGQTTWSVVAVPIAVAPGAPQPILSSITRTVAPGATETIDLYKNLTTWEGGRVGDVSQLDYTASHTGSAFDIKVSGTTLTLTASAGAIAGTHEGILITVTSYGGLTATITAVVGIAAPDAPRGATLSKQCSVTGGACVTPVLGQPGEYDPFAGRSGGGLRLTGVSTQDCAVASFAIVGTDRIGASWPPGPKPVGGSCTAVFTVEDAQGRGGTGALTLDLQGYPAAPQSITTVGYTPTSVTVEVQLGDAANAHPNLSGVALYEGTSKLGTSCAPAGPVAYRCTVNGLVNGQQHSYSARAVNPVGDSPGTTALTTWAYAAPSIANLTADAVYDPAKTSATEGVVELKITAGDDARSFRVTNTNESFTRNGNTTTVKVTLPSGSPVTVEVVPVSRFEPPTSSGSEGSSRSVVVTPVGLPSFPSAGSVTLGTTDSSRATFTIADPDLNGAHGEGTEKFYATQVDITCSADSHGDIKLSPGAVTTSNDGTFTGLEKFKPYHFFACVSNGFGVAQSAIVDQTTFVAPPAPSGSSLSYRVSSTPSGVLGPVALWENVTPPSIAPAPSDFTLYYFFEGSGPTTTFAIDNSRIPNVSAAYCVTGTPTMCGPSVPITASELGTEVMITFIPGVCPPPLTTPGPPTVSAGASPYVQIIPTFVQTDPIDFSGIWTFTVVASGPFAGINGYAYQCTN